jgi:hypothetical protein
MQQICVLVQLLFLSAISVASYVHSAPTNYKIKMTSTYATAHTSDDDTSEKDVNNGVKNEVPQLPMADPNDTSIPTLKFGESLRLEELGPIIINSDGSTRRIENWNQLSDQEKEVSWRRISKRNEERRKALLMAAETESANPSVSQSVESANAK